MADRPVIRTLRKTGSQQKSETAKDYRKIAFATSAITTITDAGAHSFNYQGVKITFCCHRTFEAAAIQAAFPRSSLVPAFSHDQEALGVLIHIDETKCSLFPIDDKPFEQGRVFYHFLIKYNGRNMLASVSLEIEAITRPSPAAFTRNTKIDAAFAVFKTKVDDAYVELHSELKRIIDAEIANGVRAQQNS